MICAGLVLNAESLRPIQWRVWAGAVEHGAKVGGKGVGEGGPREEVGMAGFFKGLERGRRRGFVDLRVSGGFL